jgi:hypothetical protein
MSTSCICRSCRTLFLYWYCWIRDGSIVAPLGVVWVWRNGLAGPPSALPVSTALCDNVSGTLDLGRVVCASCNRALSLVWRCCSLREAWKVHGSPKEHAQS